MTIQQTITHIASTGLVALLFLASAGCGGNTTETPANPVKRPENLKIETPGGGTAKPAKSRAGGGAMAKPTSPTD
ncbi:MAG: hypothetical protein ACRC33_17945, partial [Gemmataceae bacterium]